MLLGGKWTTYRIMAKEAVDAAVETCKLQPKSDCQTDGLKLEGAHGWTPNMYIRLVQDYGLESQVTIYLFTYTHNRKDGKYILTRCTQWQVSILCTHEQMHTCCHS